MRRLFAASVMVLAAAAMTAGCSSSGTPSAPSWKTSPTAVADGPGSPTVVCGSIRSVVTADMTPLGTALGAMVGRATANDDADEAKASAQALAALQKLGTDISTAAAAATDAPLREAGKTADANIQALATDPSYLSGITSMDAVAAATTRLQQATDPVTIACAGS
jgi:hypothetical protein